MKKSTVKSHTRSTKGKKNSKVKTHSRDINKPSTLRRKQKKAMAGMTKAKKLDYLRKQADEATERMLRM